MLDVGLSFFVFLRGVAVMLLQQYRMGLKRRWKNASGWVLSVWGIQWSVFGPLSSFVPTLKSDIRLWQYVATFAVTLILVAAWRLKEPTTVRMRFATTNTNIDIGFKDFFNSNDHLAIPVNEFFDGKLGDLVSPNSLHGQFVQRFYDGDARRFEGAVDAILDPKLRRVKVRSNQTRMNSYPMGTTAALSAGERMAFLFVSAESDPVTAKAHANVPMMWAALAGLWREVRDRSNGYCLVVPMVGGGQSQVGLPPQHLVSIILMSLLFATREKEVTKHVRIVLHESQFERVNLRTLVQDWS